MCAAQSSLEDDGDSAYEVYDDSDNEDEESDDGYGDEGEIGKRQPMPYYFNDPESQKQRAKAAFNIYLEDPLNDSPIIVKETKKRRETVIESFRR
jgi:hypothetical protein